MLRRKSQLGTASIIVLVGLCAALLSFGRLLWKPSVVPAEPISLPLVLSVPEPVVESPRIRKLGDLPTPRVRAEAAILYNPATREILWELNGLEVRPIASITKVMTAIVFLGQKPDLSRDVVISRSDVRRASTTYLRRGERITLRNLLHLALIASDNSAARALARVSPWGTIGFIDEMNRKAEKIGLENTTFIDPSGLDERNVSTAYDLSLLIAYASDQPQIASTMRKKSYRMRTSRRRLTVRNTNRLLGSLVVYGGKTGYIDESGYCLAAVVKLPGSDPLSVVVLGARSNAGRFAEVRRLVNWVSIHKRSLVVPGAYRAD